MDQNGDVADDPHAGDPGWFTAKSLLWALLPGVGIQRAQRDADSVLQLLRLLFTTFVMALLLIGVVVLVLSADPAYSDETTVSAAAAGVAAYGLFTLLLPSLIRRPLDCASAETLSQSYRTRFFLRLAFAESAALVGFVGVFLAERWWLYAIGVAFTSVGFARLAPTEASLSRDQDALSTAGCGLSLKEVLLEPPARD